ncbi:MAG: hypothetical protein ACLUJG_08130 [Lawsonibacter sp.]
MTISPTQAAEFLSAHDRYLILTTSARTATPSAAPPPCAAPSAL